MKKDSKFHDPDEKNAYSYTFITYSRAWNSAWYFIELEFHKLKNYLDLPSY
jgi:hypothetical protein